MAVVQPPPGAPSDFWLGHQHVRIRWFDAEERELRGCDGYWLDTLLEVGVFAGLHPTVMWEVFWHEVMHVLVEFFGFDNIPLPEEAVCVIASKGMCLMVRQNPSIVEWMKKLLLDQNYEASWVHDPFLGKDRDENFHSEVSPEPPKLDSPK